MRDRNERRRRKDGRRRGMKRSGHGRKDGKRENREEGMERNGRMREELRNR